MTIGTGLASQMAVGKNTSADLTVRPNAKAAWERPTSEVATGILGRENVRK